MTLGEQIKQARENKNLSQEELAARLGVSRQAVSKWENDSSMPQGVNREMLMQVLDLEALRSETAPVKKRKGWFGWAGWVTAAVLFIVLIGISQKGDAQDTIKDTASLQGEMPKDTTEDGSSEKESGSREQEIPAIKSVTFYDSDQNEVKEEALWYNAANIESILIQWEGGTPTTIKMFATPSGTETAELTELLLTKAVLDGDSAALLNADSLKTISMGHVFFELAFGETVVATDPYNVLYEETDMEN